MANTALPLNTGNSIPALGFGTWQAPLGETKKAVLTALKLGYRHIDCAYMYSNEDECGEAFAEAFSTGVCTREELFVTTKLWCTYHARVEQALDMSLKSLGLSYVDLYLMHWPCPMNPNGNDPKVPKLADGSRDLDLAWSHVQTWGELEKLSSTGKAKAIGVANYSVPYMKQLLKSAKTVPAVNQIENHPYLPQQDIVDLCKENNIHITAYSPLGSSNSPLLQEPEVKSVAQRKGVSVATILLSYHVARGNSVLAKSVTPSRIEDNMKIISLDSNDMSELAAIAKIRGVTRYVYPSFGVDFGFPDKPEGKKVALAA